MALTGHWISFDCYSLSPSKGTMPIIAKGLLLYDFSFFRSLLPFSSCTLSLTLHWTGNTAPVWTAKNLYKTGPSASRGEREKCATWAPVLQHCPVVLGFSWLVLLGYLWVWVFLVLCLWGFCWFIFCFCWGVFCFGVFSQNYSKCIGFLSGYSTRFTSLLHRKREGLGPLSQNCF